MIDIGLCIAYVFNHLIGEPSWKLTSLLNLDDEFSLASWYSSTQFFCVFILSSIFSYHKVRQNTKSILVILLPVIFLLMSIDESVQIHEWLGSKSDVLFSSGSRIGTSFERSGIWMFVFGLPFLTLFLMFAYSIRQHFSDKPSSFRKLGIGMAIMLTGALGFEALSNFIDNFRVIPIVFEEGFEMIGVTVMLWAAYEMAIDYMSDMDH